MTTLTDPFKRPQYLKEKTPSQPSDFPVKLEPLNIQAGLEPYQQPLSERQAAHLLRRTRTGARAADVQAFVNLAGVEAVNQILSRATDPEQLPLPAPPVWADAIPPLPDDPEDVVQAFIDNNVVWLEEYQSEILEWTYLGGLREKMAMMWHNHFVTGFESYFLATLAYRYYNLLRTHSLGNFKDFVYEIGLTPAMLMYLNGNTNEKSAPNENYARELLELFTMGPKDRLGNDNYNQTDIEEIARALTGYVNDYLNNTYLFVPGRHDDGEKTFLGRTGNWGYDDVIDILFEERPNEIAYFVCSKIYKTLVYDLPDDTIVQELATIFIDNNFEIAPVVQTLLQSAHFFDTQVIGAKIKSPLELVTGMLMEIDYTPTEENLALLPRGTSLLDQIILNPPNVAGWPGHRFWISTTSLPLRWLVTDFLLYTINELEPVDLVPLARSFPEGEAVDSAFTLPLRLASHMLSIDLAELDIGEVEDPFGGDLISFPIPDDILNGPAYAINLAKIFLSGVPWYEWSLDADGANLLLLNYLRYLAQLPEFHLS